MLFWQFANDIVPVAQAKRFYPLFGQMSSLAPVVAGLCVVRFTNVVSSGGKGKGKAVAEGLLDFVLVRARRSSPFHGSVAACYFLRARLCLVRDACSCCSPLKCDFSRFCSVGDDVSWRVQLGRIGKSYVVPAALFVPLCRSCRRLPSVCSL